MWCIANRRSIFDQRLRSPLKELHLLPGFYHDTLGEENRALAFEKTAKLY